MLGSQVAETGGDDHAALGARQPDEPPPITGPAQGRRRADVYLDRQPAHEIPTSARLWIPSPRSPLPSYYPYFSTSFNCPHTPIRSPAAGPPACVHQ